MCHSSVEAHPEVVGANSGFYSTGLQNLAFCEEKLHLRASHARKTAQ